MLLFTKPPFCATVLNYFIKVDVCTSTPPAGHLTHFSSLRGITVNLTTV